jgi:hypothetical protein
MSFVSQLKLSHDPFARDGACPLGPLRAAFERLMRHIELGAAEILVAGPAGSGKTFLLDIVEESCRERALSVLRIERGDLAHTAIGKCADVLLVDEADFVDEAALKRIRSDPEAYKTIVFACRAPRGVGDGGVPAVVKVTALTPQEARAFLVDRATAAGRPDLFAPEAVDALVDGTSGIPRLLRSVGALALFFAAYEGAGKVGADHVAKALEAQTAEGGPPSEKADSKPDEGKVPASPAAARMTQEPEPRREPPRLVENAPSAAQAKFPTPILPIIASRDPTGARRKSFAKARMFAAAVLPLLLLNGSLGEAGPASKANAKRQIAPRPVAMDARRGLERVAKAAYPGRVILAVITMPALHPFEINAEERDVAAVKKPAASAPPSKKPAKKNAPKTQRAR